MSQPFPQREKQVKVQISQKIEKTTPIVPRHCCKRNQPESSSILYLSVPPLPKHHFCINLSLLYGFQRRSPVTPSCQQKLIATDIPNILRQNDLFHSSLVLNPNHLTPSRKIAPMLNIQARIVRLEQDSAATLPRCEFFALPFMCVSSYLIL